MKVPSLVLFLACFASQAQILPTYTITNAIGDGTAGFGGDGGAATAAKLNFPMAMVRSSTGTLFITDAFNFRIRSVQGDGIIRTIAGTGTRGFTGNDGPAPAALIESSYGITTDPAGNIYFSDSLNHMIRRIGTDGRMTRVAGTGFASFTGDGGDALNASLFMPTGIVVDAGGNILFSDSQNHRIRKVGTDGKISTVVGTGFPGSSGDGEPATQASINSPQGLAMDSIGNLYITETVGQRIRKVSVDGTITTVAGAGSPGFSGDNGPATSALLAYPRSVYVDGSGTVFIADTLNNRIRAVTEDGKIQTIAGNGSFGDSADNIAATDAPLRFPRAIVPDGSGGLYLLDTDNHRVKLLTPKVALPLINDQRGIMSASEFGALPKAAAGSWIEIYGAGFAEGKRQWQAGDFFEDKAPTSLLGTSVTVGDRSTFIAYVAPNQVNAQIPYGLAPGIYDVVVKSPRGDSPPYKLIVEDAVPGVLAPQSMMIAGKQYPAAFLLDGTLAKLGHFPRAGEYITLFAVGFGPVAPFDGSGQPARRLNSLVLPLKVFIGGVPATVTYAGSAPGWVGLYQINVMVPSVPAGDALPLQIELNGKPGEQTLYMGVGN